MKNLRQHSASLLDRNQLFGLKSHFGLDGDFAHIYIPYLSIHLHIYRDRYLWKCHYKLAANIIFVF